MTAAGADDAAAARRYAEARYRLLLLELACSVCLLLLAQASGASHALARWWVQRTSAEPLILLGYLAVFGLAYYVAMLPLHFHGSFVLEHRFHLSRLTLGGWLRREAKQLAVSAVLSAVLLESLYALLRHAPSQWPLLATLGWLVFTVVLARVFPTLLLPLFYKTVPLQDAALADRLLALCRRAGLQALGVFRFDLGAETRKANAALAGLGRTRRVLLSDTLLAEFSPDEIEGVLAHEVGHHHYRHITKLLALSAVGSWAAFALTDAAGRWWVHRLGLQGLWDIAGFPVLVLWLSALSFLSLPLQNGLSRHFEWQSDRFAVSMSQPAAFAGALRRLARLNLADPQPPRWVVRWFYDHPPITERIHAAERAGNPGRPPGVPSDR